MRLFRRSRSRRAAATVRSVQLTPHLEHRCVIDVHPPLAATFPSTLHTHLEIAPGAETFVLFDPEHTDLCELDIERLRSNGVDERRGYTHLTAVARRGRVTLADAAERLAALDELAERRRRGDLTPAQLAAARERVLSRPAR